MSGPAADRDRYALAALKERRAAVAGDLAHPESRTRTEREGLSHIDAVLRMFTLRGEPEVIPARRARKGASGPIDDLSRRVMDILRRWGEPMPRGEVIDATEAETGFPEGRPPSSQTGSGSSLRDMTNGS